MSYSGSVDAHGSAAKGRRGRVAALPEAGPFDHAPRAEQPAGRRLPGPVLRSTGPALPGSLAAHPRVPGEPVAVVLAPAEAPPTAAGRSRSRDPAWTPSPATRRACFSPSSATRFMHAQRAVLERATGTGWSLRRLLERVVRAPARFTVSGRRIAMIASAAFRHRFLLVRQLRLLPGPSG